MPRPLIDRVFDDLREMVRPGDRLCAAVSGGADSVALLRLLLQLRARLGIVLSVAHLNHRLRAGESDADAAFVASLAASHDLPLIAESSAAAAYAAQEKLSLEAAGRQLRYAFFARLIRDGRATRVATAHTADDQAETVLLRLLRGAGTRGLAGIHPSRSAEPEPVAGAGSAIIRPLLNVRRADLRDFLDDLAQPWREDASNQDLHFLRNRVRAHLLPRIEKDYNPSIVRVLGEAAQVARAEEEFWTGEVDRLLPKIAAEDGAFRIEAIQAQPLAVQRRLLRALAEQSGLRLDFEHIEQMRNLLSAASGEVPLPGGFRVSASAGELRVEHAATSAAQSRRSPADGEPSTVYTYRLPVPGEVRIRELGARIQAITLPVAEAARGYNRDQWLDPASIEAELEVRNWRPGDRFWPLHSKAPKKVKELLQSRHLPAGERVRWPVAVSGREIVWMRGFPAASGHHAGKAQQVLVIQDLPL